MLCPVGHVSWRPWFTDALDLPDLPGQEVHRFGLARPLIWMGRCLQGGGWVGSVLPLVAWFGCLLQRWPSSVVLCFSAPGTGLQ